MVLLYTTSYSSDMLTGAILGRGSFTVVRAVRNIQLGDLHFIKQSQNQEYAIKKIRDDLCSTSYYHACNDLENEAELLSSVDHPQIIKIQ